MFGIGSRLCIMRIERRQNIGIVEVLLWTLWIAWIKVSGFGKLLIAEHWLADFVELTVLLEVFVALAQSAAKLSIVPRIFVPDILLG